MDNFVDRKVFYAGDIIFREGTKGDCAYLIEKGEVRVTKGPASNEIVLGTLRGGSILGEMAMIDAEPRMATATAVTETTVTIVTHVMFERKLEAADPFLRALLRVMVRTLRDVSTRVQSIEDGKAKPTAG